MDYQSNTCQTNVCTGSAAPTQLPSEATEAAEALACLLTDTQELQNFLRLARLIRIDNEVNRLLSLLNGFGDEEIPQEPSLQTLEEQLEGLPIVKEYRQAEQSVRELFRQVDEVISGAAGLAFAENAKPSACG